MATGCCAADRTGGCANGQSTPHLQIRVLDVTGQPWRVAVNVQSDTGSEVVYWLVARWPSTRSCRLRWPASVHAATASAVWRWTTGRTRAARSS